MKTIYLFPGAHKTGTSYLQKALETCRDQIEARGFGLARRGKYYSELHEPLRIKIDEFEPHLEEVREKAKLVFGVDDLNRNLILSIENLFGEFSQSPYRGARKVLTNLKAIFPDHRVKCVFYIRRQDTFLESNYVQSIHKGRDWDWDEFWEEYKDTDLSWFEIIRPMKRNVENGDFVLRTFETLRRSEKLFLQEFFEQIDGLPVDEFVQTCAGNLEETNISLSKKGLDVARTGFQKIESRSEREKYARHLQQIFGVNRDERFSMPSDLRVKIAKTFSEDNQRLLKRHNCAGGVLKYFMFTEILNPEDAKEVS